MMKTILVPSQRQKQQKKMMTMSKKEGENF